MDVRIGEVKTIGSVAAQKIVVTDVNNKVAVVLHKIIVVSGTFKVGVNTIPPNGYDLVEGSSELITCNHGELCLQGDTVEAKFVILN